LKLRLGWRIFWTTYFIFGDEEEFTINYIQAWKQRYEAEQRMFINSPEHASALPSISHCQASVIMFIDHKQPIHIPCRFDMTDKEFIIHFHRFYFLRKVLAGLIPLWSLRELSVIQNTAVSFDIMISLSNLTDEQLSEGNIIGHSVEKLNFGRYEPEISSLHHFLDPYTLRGNNRVQSLIQKKVIASASGTPTPPQTPLSIVEMSFPPQAIQSASSRPSTSSSTSSFAIQNEKGEHLDSSATERPQTTSPVYNSGPSFPMRPPTVPLTDRSPGTDQTFLNLNPLSIPSRPSTVPPLHKSTQSEVGSAIASISVHRGALNFVSKWNTDSTESIVVVPIIFSLLFAILWPAVAAGALHADAQTSVWTGLLLALYVVGIPALLIAMVAFLESKDQVLKANS
jgi:hypothetical protein